MCSFSGAVNVSAKMCDVQKGNFAFEILYKHITAAAAAAAFYEPDEMCREILSIFLPEYLPVLTTTSYKYMQPKITSQQE